MTRRLRPGFGLALLVFATALNAQAPASRLVHDTVHSAALEGNKYGDSPNRSLLVYLPPSYASNPTKRYPVVYLLHGFTASEASWARGYAGFDIGRSTDSLVAAGAVREMIIVMPNALTRLHGSFYVNSSSEGGWDDFISSELVSYIDAKYRTLAAPRSRGSPDTRWAGSERSTSRCGTRETCTALRTRSAHAARTFACPPTPPLPRVGA